MARCGAQACSPMRPLGIRVQMGEVGGGSDFLRKPLTPLNRTMLKKSRDSIGVSSICVVFFLPFLALVGVLGPLSFVPPFLEPSSLGDALGLALPP